MRREMVGIAGVLAAVAAFWLLHGGGTGPDASPAGDSPLAGSAPGAAAAPDARGLAASAPKRAAAPGAASAVAGATELPTPVDSFRAQVVDERGVPIAGAIVTPVPDGTKKVAWPAAARTPADGRVAFTVPEVEYLTVHAAFAGRALRGMEGTLEREKETRLVLVPACALKVRVLDDATGVPVEGAQVRVVTGQMIDAVWSSDLDSPFAVEALTDRDGRAVLSCEGGLSNVQVIPRAHAPKLTAHVNVPPDGRDLDVRVARGGVVEGRVLAAAGTPVRAARVRLDVTPLYRRDLTTGPDGRFRFEAVGTDSRLWDMPGETRAAISVSAEGFARTRVALDPPKPGATTTTEVRLLTGRRVAGVVRTADGKPAVRATVALEWSRDDVFSPSDPTRTVTDGEGRFALLDVGAGEIDLWADDEVGRTHVRMSLQVPEDADPAPVVLVLPDRSGRSTVRVLDADGVGVAGAKVTVKPGPPVIDTVAKGVTGLDGSLVLSGLPTEVATVQVLPPGSVLHAREVGRAELSGGEVVIRLEAGEITGRALRIDGTPARVRLALDRDIAVSREQGDPVETDAEGRFRFRRLPKGSFKLRLVDEGGVLISMPPWFRTGYTDARVFVARADEAARFNVEALLVDAATDKPISIRGFAAEFLPAAGAAGPRFNMMSTDTGGTTEVGRFVSYMPVPPGVYDVTFSARGWRPARLPGLRVPRDGPVPVLRVDSGARVEGRVLSPEGKPLAGVTVEVGTEDERQAATTGEDGAFAVTGLEAGAQSARAYGRLVVEETRTVRAPAVGDERIEWRLAPAGALEVDFSGLSLEGASEKIVVTPAGGKPLQEEDDGTLRWGEHGTRHGAHFDGIAPGRWRVEAWQGATAHPAQEVEVKAGEATVVRVPAAASPPK